MKIFFNFSCAFPFHLNIWGLARYLCYWFLVQYIVVGEHSLYNFNTLNVLKFVFWPKYFLLVHTLSAFKKQIYMFILSLWISFPIYAILKSVFLMVSQNFAQTWVNYIIWSKARSIKHSRNIYVLFFNNNNNNKMAQFKKKTCHNYVNMERLSNFDYYWMRMN